MPQDTRKASVAKRESKHVDFKEQFDVNSTGEWCELLKDMVAMANSGGGWIVVGVRNNADTSEADLTAVRELDPAKIADKLHAYTGEHMSSVEIHDIERPDGSTVVGFAIDPSPYPVAFSRPGTYPTDGDKQKTAFSQGTVYFRHGAKSEPGTTADLRDFVDRHSARHVDELRRDWLNKIRKISEAPPGTELAVIKRTEDAEGGTMRVQLTDDPSAPVYGRLSRDATHPYRATELIDAVKERLAGRTPFNRHDLDCLRRVLELSDKSDPEFCHQPKYGSMQYSDDFARWIVEQFEAAPEFFSSLRAQDLENRRAAR